VQQQQQQQGHLAVQVVVGVSGAALARHLGVLVVVGIVCIACGVHV
jgi:hypothetical protein